MWLAAVWAQDRRVDTSYINLDGSKLFSEAGDTLNRINQTASHFAIYIIY